MAERLAARSAERSADRSVSGPIPQLFNSWQTPFSENGRCASGGTPHEGNVGDVRQGGPPPYLTLTRG